MTSGGIRYSNIEPDQEIRAPPCATGVIARPSRNQCRAGSVALGDREEAGQPRLGRQEVVAIGIQRRLGNNKSDRQQLPLLVEEKAELHRHRHGAERILQHDQPGVARSDGLRRRRQISSMRVDRGEARLRPIQEIRSAAVAALERDRAGDIEQDRRLAGEFRQLRCERFVFGKGRAFKRLGSWTRASPRVGAA